jgi:glucose/arabinose dehydrogenase
MRTFFACALLWAFSFSSIAQTPAYTKTTIVTGMQYPVAFDVMPNGNFLCTQKGGNSNPAVAAQILVYNSSGTYIGIFYDLTDSVDADFERGLLGICVDPNFSTNRYVYCYYVHLYNNDERLRVVRFTENNNTGTNPFIVFDYDIPENIPGNHVGGNVRMHASEPDKIYISIGDLASSQTDSVLNYAHLLTNPYGKIIRMNTNGTIPSINPYYDDGNPLTGNCDMIWSYGHRNPFDMAFSPVNDSLYSSENGLNTWDEANIIMKGKNYGWNICEGMYRNSSTTVPCNHPGFTDPLTEWGSPLGAVTGIIIYSGTVFPTFDKHMLVADNDYGRVYDCTLGNAPLYNTVTSNVYWTDLTTSGGLTTMREGTDGCIYAMKGGYTTNGQIYRVCPQGLYVGESKDQDFFLFAPVPNPSYGTATINYQLKKDAAVCISLFDISGKLVRELMNSHKIAGNYSLLLNANELGLDEGTYFCTMKIGAEGAEFFQTVRLVIAR